MNYLTSHDWHKTKYAEIKIIFVFGIFNKKRITLVQGFPQCLSAWRATRLYLGPASLNFIKDFIIHRNQILSVFTDLHANNVSE